MRWALVVACCGCGRLGFDPLESAGGSTSEDARQAIGDGSTQIARCADTDLGSAVGAGVAQGTLVAGDGDDFKGCAGSSSPDRAFAWTAPATASFTFSICNSASGWDSVLEVFDPTACSGKALACRDDTCGSHEAITRNLMAGQTIVIVVDGWLDRGAYVLDVQQN
jgi:hypothetical protein